MLAILKTAERTGHAHNMNNYVFQRHMFAYQTVLTKKLLGKNVMEMGCGTGYGSQALAPHCQLYLAIDKHRPDNIPFAGALQFEYANLPDLKHIPDNSFDTIICFQVIEHIHQDEALLHEAKRILAPGGTLLLTTPNRQQSLTRNPFHIREYMPWQMNLLVKKVFPASTIKGVHGNTNVMSYYEENKRMVQRITRWDVLQLQHLLPAFLLKIPYSIINNLNRYFIWRNRYDVTEKMTVDDFYLSDDLENCLDYFCICRKQ